MAAMCVSKCLTRVLLKKPFSVISAETQTEKLKRHLSLFDLLAIGIGGTVGSGVFVLSGLIARNYAGPGVVFSWLVAGVGCLFSAMSYAEFATVLNNAGSSYAYVYYGLGELPAVLAAWFLCLEYGVSGAAVSRSWGDKLINWTGGLGIPLWHPYAVCPSLNPFAGLLQTSAVLLLLAEADVGKVTIKIFTIVKLLLVVFMIVGGLCLFEHKHVEKLAPMGVAGIFRGATSAFFGFLGYDEVCCLSGEAINPKKDLPWAIFGTILCVTVLYVMASLALVGMVPFEEIDVESGFGMAFKERGWASAHMIVSIGEIVTLPLVVLISFLAQPRLLFAMAEDGLLPGLFAEVSSSGSLFKGTLVSGAVCVVIALFVPFVYLDDMISAGVLLSFNLTNTSLLVVRRQNPRNPSSCLRLTVCYNLTCFLLALLCTNINLSSPPGATLVGGVVIILLLLVYTIASSCPEAHVHHVVDSKVCGEDTSTFRVPWMPYPPLIGIFINFFLIAQLSWLGMLLIVLYTCLAVVFYFLYGIKHSVGSNTQWARAQRSRSDDNITGNLTGNYDIDDKSNDDGDDDRDGGRAGCDVIGEIAEGVWFRVGPRPEWSMQEELVQELSTLLHPSTSLSTTTFVGKAAIPLGLEEEDTSQHGSYDDSQHAEEEDDEEEEEHRPLVVRRGKLTSAGRGGGVRKV